MRTCRRTCKMSSTYNNVKPNAQQILPVLNEALKLLKPGRLVAAAKLLWKPKPLVIWHSKKVTSKQPVCNLHFKAHSNSSTPSSRHALPRNKLINRRGLPLVNKTWAHDRLPNSLVLVRICKLRWPTLALLSKLTYRTKRRSCNHRVSMLNRPCRQRWQINKLDSQLGSKILLHSRLLSNWARKQDCKQLWPTYQANNKLTYRTKQRRIKQWA